MAKRVTPDEIVKMIQLYTELGTYAAVGQKIGRSGSTVKRYVELSGTPKMVAHTLRKVVSA